MPADIYSLAPINLRIAGGLADVVIPCENHAFSPEILNNPHFHSGNLSPTAIVVPGANPRVNVSMPFRAAYELVALGIVKLTTLDVYLSKYVDFVRYPGPNHPKLSLSNGAFAAIQIVDWSVNVDGILMANVSIDLLSNDAENPFNFSPNGNSLPTLATQPRLNTLGPVLINGTMIPGAESNSGQINGNTIVQRTDGDLYPRVAARTIINPSARIGHKDPVAVLAKLGLLGTHLTADAEMYFKDYDPITGITSETSAIKLTVAKGRAMPEAWNADQGAVAGSGIMIVGSNADGLGNPFAVTLDVNPPPTV